MLADKQFKYNFKATFKHMQNNIVWSQDYGKMLEAELRRNQNGFVM